MYILYIIYILYLYINYLYINLSHQSSSRYLLRCAQVGTPCVAGHGDARPLKRLRPATTVAHAHIQTRCFMIQSADVAYT